MQTKTITGKPLTVDVETKTLTIEQGSFAYKGPYVMRYKGERINYFEIQMDGKEQRVGISVADGETINKAQIAAEEQKMETLFPGISALRAAQYDEERYSHQFNRMMEDEGNDGARPPAPVKADLNNLVKQYPRAAIYLKAESYAAASNHHKSSAGTNAMRLLETGGSIQTAEATLDNWSPESAFWD